MRKVVKWIVIVLAGLIGLLVLVLVSGVIYEKVSGNRDVANFPAPGQLFDVGGRNLHLSCMGSGSPTVILEAGGGSSSVQWWPLQEQLAEFSHVCSYDRPGFGWSDPSPTELTFEDGARDLKALLSAAQVPGPYILVGHSKGGLHVRTYARLYPDDVAGVLLLDAAEEESIFATSNFEFVELSLKEAQAPLLLSRFGIMRLLLRFSPDAVPIPDLPEELVQPYHRELARPGIWEAAISGGAAYRLTSTELRVAGGFGQLGDVPLIVITHGIPYTGAQAFQEEWWPAAQERLVSLSSNSELIVAENSGHSIMWDEPELVIDSVRELISQAGHQE